MLKFIIIFLILWQNLACSTDNKDITQVKQILIQQSISNYSGNCPCPYNTMRNGRKEYALSRFKSLPFGAYTASLIILNYKMFIYLFSDISYNQKITLISDHINASQFCNNFLFALIPTLVILLISYGSSCLSKIMEIELINFSDNWSTRRLNEIRKKIRVLESEVEKLTLRIDEYRKTLVPFVQVANEYHQFKFESNSSVIREKVQPFLDHAYKEARRFGLDDGIAPYS